MSWLQSTSNRPRSNRERGLATDTPVDDWLRQRLWIETDSNGEILIDTRTTVGSRWVHTYSSRDLLEARSSADFDNIHCVDWTGAQLRTWLRNHAPDAGALYHSNPVDEVIVLRPEAQSVQRVSLED
ncbi:hypothetical protein [Saccharopolyspora griseoalba]|uniref:Uncharacterized protein n=1 Tax=Saccharopolyspora griseoalba TaxID=1431848 RepID=A0ABW2LTI8_9PSEU